MEKTLDLDTLGIGAIEGIAASFGAYMRDCAVISLESQEHIPGVKLLRNGAAKDEFFVLEWHNENEIPSSSFSYGNRTTDFGAMGIAILLTMSITDYDCFETSYLGSGIDFWLSRKGSFLQYPEVAVLEVTGIRQSSPKNTIQRRLKLKLSQTETTAKEGIPVFISIVEFSKPEVFYQKK